MIEKGLEHTLRDILGRSEETVRAFDIKSEIAMLCFVLSVEAGQAFINLSQLRTTRPYLSLVLLVTFIAALFAYMSVLFPAQNPKLLKETGRQSGDEQKCLLHNGSRGYAPRGYRTLRHASRPCAGYCLRDPETLRHSQCKAFALHRRIVAHFRVLRLTFDCCMLLLSLEASVSNFGPEPDGRCTRVYRGRGRVLDGGGPVEQGYRDRSSVRR